MFDAKLALNQLTQSENGISRLNIMVGAYNLAKDDNSVMFKFKAKSPYNYCKITLDADDTYTLTLQKYVWTRCKMTKEKVISGLYFDMLKNEFEQNAKLYLSL